MSDPYVVQAQVFINTTYGNGALLGIAPLQEDGQTGWSVMHALTRALQYEMGIEQLSNAFGPLTYSTLEANYPVLNEGTMPSPRFCQIIQSAMYCTGYTAGAIDGFVHDIMKTEIQRLKSNMGVSEIWPGSGLEPKVMRGLFNLDAYVRTPGGSEAVRATQRWLNGRYAQRRDFAVIPCDGHHSRDVARALLFGIQYEIGMEDGVANGNFGPGTQAGLRQNTVSIGSSGAWSRLFTAAMLLNGWQVTFGDFTTSVETRVREFQEFCMLTVNGTGDYRTWASLLVSYGDPTREGSACDGVTKITPARAQTLISHGYQYIGRYLYSVPDPNLPEKQIQPGELQTIVDYGLSCFPIYQTWSRDAAYFSSYQGTLDAFQAIEWAQFHGFKPGTIIYFAVDYDAVDWEVTEFVMPHFQNIHSTLSSSVSGYRVGIYGPRNVCQRVSNEGYAETSFVADLSSGFSGNLGYPLPDNWAYDQISTITIGSGDGAIEIDNNIATGRDTGQDSFNPPKLNDQADQLLPEEHHEGLLSDVQGYLESIGVPETGGDGWDPDWVTLWGITTTVALERVLSIDWFLTRLSRDLGFRKALIQAPIIWELRKLNAADMIADDAVKAGQRDDSSTGWAQIFAYRAIQANNFCVEQELINGVLLDEEDDLRDIWFQLHEDQIFNARSASYLLFFNSELLANEGTPVPLPSLTTTRNDSQLLLQRYNGRGPDAEAYGHELIGLYDVLESYNALVRA